jgi:C4-dicarboxylate-specific signal transduction histidine kinase
MKTLRKKIRIFLISKLIKEDDENHLLFLYKQHAQLNRLLTMGQVSSGIFHDLFTPISSLSLMIEHFNKNGLFDNHELKSSFIESKDELNNLVKMIQEYLRENTVTERFQICNTIEQSIRFIKYRITKNNIQLSFIRNSDVIIETNKLRLIQVLNNILLNSINSFEDQDLNNRKISISVYIKKKSIKISITDNGSGIPRKILKKIYSPLFTTREKGIGLGLSTTKDIITNELNGSIKIFSKESRGTRVVIVLLAK